MFMNEPAEHVTSFDTTDGESTVHGTIEQHEVEQSAQRENSLIGKFAVVSVVVTEIGPDGHPRKRFINGQI